MAYYDLKKEDDVANACSRFNALLEKMCIIELKEKRSRSLNQNSYLHLILSWYGNEYGASLETIKTDIFKRLVNKETFLIERENKINDWRSSKDLDSVEMTHCIERFRNWSASDEGGNIYIPAPNETDFLNEIDLIIKQNQYL